MRRLNGLMLLLPLSSFASPFYFSGFIDGAYNYLERSENLVSDRHYISNVLSTNALVLHQLTATMAWKEEEGFGVQFTPVLGQDAFDLAPQGLDPDIGISNIGLTATEAYGQYKINNLTVMGGLLVAYAGYEPIVPTENVNFSRSIISSFAVPDTVTGLRAVYEVNHDWELIAGINDGWDTIEDWERNKTVELGTTYTPNEFILFSIAGMTGGERAVYDSTSGEIGQRNILDAYGTLYLTPKLALQAEYNYGYQNKAELPDGSIGQAHWQGLAGYFNYYFNPKWYASLRGEIFDDHDGYLTGVTQVWKEVTLSLGYFLNKDVLIRAEARHDLSNENAFVDIGSDHTANNQQLFGIEAYYIF